MDRPQDVDGGPVCIPAVAAGEVEADHHVIITLVLDDSAALLRKARSAVVRGNIETGQLRHGAAPPLTAVPLLTAVLETFRELT